MTISKMKNRPISFLFMIISYVIFWAVKLLVVGGNIDAQFTPKSYILTIVLGLVIGFIYVLTDIYKIKRLEKDVMKKSHYLDEYDCSIFKDYDVPFIIEIQDGRCYIYLNQYHFFLVNYKVDKSVYISGLKSRYKNLNKMDIFYIYSYKYIITLLFTCSFFVFWHFCMYMVTINSVFIAVVAVLLAPIVLTCICCAIDDGFLYFVKKAMKKRNLEIFID